MESIKTVSQQWMAAEKVEREGRGAFGRRARIIWEISEALITEKKHRKRILIAANKHN